MAQAALDMELRYRPTHQIDLARFELWARQLIVDAGAKSLGGANGDIAGLEWTRDRFAASLEPADLTRINVHLLTLRERVVDGNLMAASAEAARLRRIVAGLELTSPT